MIDIDSFRKLLLEKPIARKRKPCKHCGSSLSRDEYVMLTDEAWQLRGYAKDDNACFSCMNEEQTVLREELAMVLITISPLTLHLLSNEDIEIILSVYKDTFSFDFRELMEYAVSIASNEEKEKLSLWATGLFPMQMMVEMALRLIKK